VQAAPADHPYRLEYLSNLGIALRTRFERAGAAGDLDAAIDYLREAAQAAPAGHPDRAGYLTNLGSVLWARFERAGAAGDLDAAIEAARQAVQAAPVGHPDRAEYLSNLGAMLRARFERDGAAGDLDAAIEAGHQAVQAAPAGHHDRARSLSDLGAALRARFGRAGVAGDLDAAIEAGQQAVQATLADDPYRAEYLTNLGIARWARFERAGAAGDLDAAIDYLREAVQATPTNHPSARRLLDLTAVLATRFERFGAVGDLDAAIAAGRQAVQAAPAGHPYRAECLANLGAVLRTRFERFGAAEDGDAAFQRYAEAAGVDAAPASVRIGTGRVAASLAARTDPARAASLLEAAVLLLPEVAPRLLERGDQQYALGRFVGLAADAAALALSDPAVPTARRPARALRLLEAARGVMLSQALSTRGDLSELRQRHPDLAARFVELRDWLDRPSAAVGPDLAGRPGDRAADALEHVIRDRRHANAEFTELLARIRGLEGFGTFALPPSAGHLEAQAEQGPVVVFNVSAHRSDAILLTSGGITSQPLPGLDQANVIDQIDVCRQALDTIATATSPLDRVAAQTTLRQVLAWLWDNATGPLLDALGFREPPAPGQPWPRLWWVPGGLLSLLPVHAAGHHTSPPDSGHRTVMDRVISSYTPTVGALTHARTARPGAARDAAMQSLIVAMPATPDLPGGGRLAHVPAEVALAEARLPRPTVLTESTAATPTRRLPTKAAVLEHLPGCAIAHFACHGYTDPADPSQSRLLLHDHRRDPLTVAALAPVALDHAQLAYLSACGTARTSDIRLLDEAIHLTSAFQLAGFPSVIGTQWEIDDAIAVDIADTFYTALTSPDGTLDPSHAARALHHATRTLRDQQPATPYLWASHIHAGA
jgi:tetratricopeptide (TPR) repeat protein